MFTIIEAENYNNFVSDYSFESGNYSLMKYYSKMDPKNLLDFLI